MIGTDAKRAETFDTRAAAALAIVHDRITRGRRDAVDDAWRIWKMTTVASFEPVVED